MKRSLFTLPFILAMLAASPALAGMVPTSDRVGIERADCLARLPLAVRRASDTTRAAHCRCVADLMTKQPTEVHKTSAAPPGPVRRAALRAAAEQCGLAKLAQSVKRQ